MNRRLVVGAVALGALTVGTLGGPAGASGKFRVVKFSYTSVSGPSVSGSPHCDASGNCTVSYTFPSQLSGDLQGTGTTDGILYSKSGSSTFQFSSFAMVVGSVRGCGSGSFVTYFPLTTAGSEPFTARSTMVPGSGTGDLAGSSQVGPSTYTYDPATNTTTGSGSLRCRVG